MRMISAEAPLMFAKLCEVHGRVLFGLMWHGSDLKGMAVLVTHSCDRV